jgi:hypothetical protein
MSIIVIFQILYLMYVDDSGTPSIKDEVRYYVISGVIVNSSDLLS